MEKPACNLVVLLPVRNGAADLPGYLESVSGFADAVVALDDGSTDGTARILKDHPLVKLVLSNPRRETYAGWDDSGNRNRLLAAAGALNPNWILSLDADERIGPDEARTLSEFIRHGAARGAAYGFRICRMIENDRFYQETDLWVYRLFAYRPGQRFPSARLHFVPVPTDIPRGHWAKTRLRIQHRSDLTEQRRRARFQKYRESDPNCEFQKSYGHLLKPPSEIKPWTESDPSAEVLLVPKRHRRIAEQLAGHSVFHEPLDPDRPALSVVVISQNDLERIGEVMEALVRQKTDLPFEVILVNSGNDGTVEFVRERFPRVRVLHLPEPVLPGKARNEGLKIARGDYVTFPGSHIVVSPGTLQRQIETHQKGFSLATGSVMNGTRTWAGWASYFLDHWPSLPNIPSEQLKVPPSRCSFMRGPLVSIGGFPEDRRTAEDTKAINQLYAMGHVAYRCAEDCITHRSPCRNPGILLKHHFKRGLGFGRMVWEYPGPKKNRSFKIRRARRLLTRYPARRIYRITKHALRFGKPMRGQFILSFPLIVAGTLSAALGAVVYLWRAKVPPSNGTGTPDGTAGGSDVQRERKFDPSKTGVGSATAGVGGPS